MNVEDSSPVLNEDIDGEVSSLSDVSFSVVGVGTLMLWVKLNLYVGVRRTVIVGVVDGLRDDVGVRSSSIYGGGAALLTVCRGIEASFGVEYDDEWDDEADGVNVGVSRGVDGG